MSYPSQPRLVRALCWRERLWKTIKGEFDPIKSDVDADNAEIVDEEECTTYGSADYAVLYPSHLIPGALFLV